MYVIRDAIRIQSCNNRYNPRTKEIDTTHEQKQFVWFRILVCILHPAAIPPLKKLYRPSRCYTRSSLSPSISVLLPELSSLLRFCAAGVLWCNTFLVLSKEISFVCYLAGRTRFLWCLGDPPHHSSWKYPPPPQ